MMESWGDKDFVWLANKWVSLSWESLVSPGDLEQIQCCLNYSIELFLRDRYPSYGNETTSLALYLVHKIKSEAEKPNKIIGAPLTQLSSSLFTN